MTQLQSMKLSTGVSSAKVISKTKT